MPHPVIVTGAAGFLGQAVVERLSAGGLRVLGLDLALSMPERGQTAFRGGVDLADAAGVDAGIADLLTDVSALAGLVNVAGGFAWETLEQGSADSWDRLYRVNVRTAVNCCRAALPRLRSGGGAIVNIGANAALRAGAGMGAYAASKAGVARLTEALAEEEKDNGVRVNAVLPSIIDTPVNRADMPDADFSSWVAPEALADVVAFLLSPAARAITGASIPVVG